jgi:hypothetical protein
MLRQNSVTHIHEVPFCASSSDCWPNSVRAQPFRKELSAYLFFYVKSKDGVRIFHAEVRGRRWFHYTLLQNFWYVCFTEHSLQYAMQTWCPNCHSLQVSSHLTVWIGVWISLLLRCISHSTVWIGVTPFTGWITTNCVMWCLVVTRFVGWLTSKGLNCCLGFTLFLSADEGCFG